jgi:hypothetical protein
MHGQTKAFALGELANLFLRRQAGYITSGALKALAAKSGGPADHKYAPLSRIRTSTEAAKSVCRMLKLLTGMDAGRQSRQGVVAELNLSRERRMGS